MPGGSSHSQVKSLVLYIGFGMPHKRKGKCFDERYQQRGVVIKNKNEEIKWAIGADTPTKRYTKWQIDECIK